MKNELYFETLEAAVVAAKEMCAVLDTFVKITECDAGYELFGTGNFVMEIKE